MSAARKIRLLRGLIAVLGAVAIVAGAIAVLTGASGQIDGGPAGASVESEYRFYAALWIAYGVLALRAAPTIDRQPLVLRALMAVLFAAGVARGIGWVDAGEPHPFYIALMCLELLIPPTAVFWQARL